MTERQWKQLARDVLLGFLVGAAVMIGVSYGVPDAAAEPVRDAALPAG